MKRKIISINEELCNGCSLCVDACHEGALRMIDGKAKLISDQYCDGLGDCLPECPTGAIKIIERDADDFNEVAVKIRMEEIKKEKQVEITADLPCGCPGSMSKNISKKPAFVQSNVQNTIFLESQLQQWPVQIKLVPVNAPYFNDAHLLVAASCSAYAYANFHNDFIKNKITIIGCPKLDAVNYADKLTEIIKNNNLKSVTVVRMEVPCCGGIENAVKQALINSGKMIPWNIVTITTEGNIKEN